MKLNRLTLNDKEAFCRYLEKREHELAAYSFENIYIWKELFEIEWGVINDSLCVFFTDKIGSFLYLAPLAAKNDPVAIEEAFSILDKRNKNKEVSRIENAEECDVQFYMSLGYKCRQKSSDYLCLRNQISEMRGDKFKSKRSCVNYFRKHNAFEYLPFSSKYKDECLGLYELWMRQRMSANSDLFYRAMLQDSFNSLRVALDNYKGLSLSGRIVKVNNALKAFTFGFRLNRQTFCLLYEIADRSVKGLAQFIFARFCSELKEYKYVNIMDDSGLENLKKVKLSYHPARLIPAYIIKRDAR